MPPRRNMCNSRTSLETNYCTVVPYEPRADTSFVHRKFEPLIDLTYEKLEEEPKREVSSSMTATPPLPTSTIILPPSTQQGPYLRQTARIRKSSEVAHTSRYRQEQETKNREELCCDCPKARESAELRVREEDIPKTALRTSERDRLIVVDRDMFVMFEREHLNVSIMRMLRLKEVARKTVGMHLEFAPDYAFSDSLLLTPLCCDDIHDVTLRVSALAGCDRLVSEPLVIEKRLKSQLPTLLIHPTWRPHTDAEIVSPMDVHVHHEVPSKKTLTLLTIPVSVISKSSPIYSTIIPQSIPSFTHPPPQSTPTPPPATEATNPHSALPNFASVFQFNNRVTELEKEVVELKKDPLHTQVKTLVDDHLDARLGATRDEFINRLSSSITARVTEQVKIQLPYIMPKEVSNFAPLMIQSMVTESLEHVVLAMESSQP
ncbi:hypothetical protein Tco_0641789 [Tanacetum coccineum]